MPMGWLADRCTRAPIVGGLEPRVRHRRASCPARRRTRSCCSGRGSCRAWRRRTQAPSTRRCSPTPTRSGSAVGSPRRSGLSAASSVSPAHCWSAPSRCGSVALPRAVGGGRSSCSASPSGSWRSRRSGSRSHHGPMGTTIGARRGAEVDDAEVPISIEMAFARLMQNRTLRAMVFALAAIGFQLFPMVVADQLLPPRRVRPRRVGTRPRRSLSGGAAAVVVLPLLGRRFDMLYRTGPPARCGSSPADPARRAR